MPVTCPRCGKQFKRHFGSHVWVCNVTNEELFWLKVEKTPTCWLWQGAARWDGYGRWNTPAKQMTAHRFSYELKHGQIPEGMSVMHTCDKPRCVNPDHLRLGTHQENMIDMARKRRGTAVFTNDQVLEIRGLLGKLPAQKIADMYGTSVSTIHAIKIGRNYAHVNAPTR